MPNYAVTFARSARKELENLPPQIGQRVFRRIETLAFEPRPTGCVKLKGQTNLWRIRVGDYRVVYTIDESLRTVDISVIRHRKDVYRDI